MKITDLVQVNPIFRNYRKAITLRASLKRRADYLRSKSELKIDRSADILIDLNIFISRLDNNELIQHPPKWLFWPVEDCMTYAYGPCRPGPATLEPFEQELVDVMNVKGQKQRAGEHAFDLQCALAYAHAQRHALLFNTLTVSDEHYDKVFAVRSTCFQRYIRDISNKASYRDPEHYNPHQYFACVEEGGKTGRLHIHVLHITSKPLAINDPNYGRSHPTSREVPSLKRFWPYGWSSPIAVRYSLSDAYSKIGWRWPLDKDTMTSIPTRGVGSIGGYMAKYCLKAYTSEKRSDYLWRVRKSRQLGAELLSLLTTQLSTKTLQVIPQLPTLKTQFRQLAVPPRKLRLAALKELQGRLSTETLFVSIRDVSSLPSLLHSARASTQPTPGLSQQNVGFLKTLPCSETDVSNAYAELSQAAEEITAAYFPLHTDIRISSRHVSN